MTTAPGLVLPPCSHGCLLDFRCGMGCLPLGAAHGREHMSKALGSALPWNLLPSQFSANLVGVVGIDRL